MCVLLFIIVFFFFSMVFFFLKWRASFKLRGVFQIPPARPAHSQRVLDNHRPATHGRRTAAHPLPEAARSPPTAPGGSGRDYYLMIIHKKESKSIKRKKVIIRWF